MTQYSGFGEPASWVIFLAAIFFALGNLNQCRERFGRTPGNLAACGILLIGVLAAHWTTSIIKAEHLSGDDIYIGMVNTFDSFPGRPVRCNPKGAVRELPTGMELVKTYKPNEPIQLQLVIGNAHESIALENALLFLNFHEELVVNPSGDWEVNEQNKAVAIRMKDPVYSTTCNKLFGTVNLQFPSAGTYHMSAHLTGHNIKPVHSKITFRLNDEKL